MQQVMSFFSAMAAKCTIKSYFEGVLEAIWSAIKNISDRDLIQQVSEVNELSSHPKALGIYTSHHLQCMHITALKKSDVMKLILSPCVVTAVATS